MSQFVIAKFRPEDSRAYTYLWDGEPLDIGAEVKVLDNRSDGWKIVTVVGVTDEEPKFACKPILGKIEPEPSLADAAEQMSADIDPEELF